MAVVSISRIQVRRGQKNTGPGLPQLASGELGWAIDTRELFIGNGSVQQGAPAVGNTKILTEFDDIFSLENVYEYKEDVSYIQTGFSQTSPIKRSIKERLDDRVSVRAFGALGNNSNDDTEALQRAIDQHYLTSAIKDEPQGRVIIHIEPGIYLISGTIYLPPFVTLVGAGLDKTIIKQTENVYTFKTVNQDSKPGNPASDTTTTSQNQARNLYLEGIKIIENNLGSAVLLHSCKNSVFRNIEIKGVWGNSSTIENNNNAIELVNTSDVVHSNNNVFENCVFENYSYAVVSNWNIMNNIWDNCEFKNLGYGISFDNNPSANQFQGPTDNIVKYSKFKNINKIGFLAEQGERNTSQTNSYDSVGNDAGPEKSPKHPVISFSEKTNKSINDYFSRTSNLIDGANLSNVPYVPEIAGPVFYELNHENNVSFGQIQNVRIFRLPAAYNQSYEIDYTLVSEIYNAVRFGKMLVNANVRSNQVEMFDEYNFIGNQTYEEAVKFNAVIRDLDSDTEPDTIIVRVVSDMPNDDQSQLKFTINAKRSDLN